MWSFNCSFSKFLLKLILAAESDDNDLILGPRKTAKKSGPIGKFKSVFTLVLNGLTYL